MRFPCAAFTMLLSVACGGSSSPEPNSEPESTEEESVSESVEPEDVEPEVANDRVAAPPPLPANIQVEVPIPGPDASRYATATVSLESMPWTVTGCIGPRGACEETARVELDDARRVELVRLLDEVRSIPRCEPDAIFPGERDYRVRITGAPRVYEGRFPHEERNLATRNAGPCRADARLGWWIAQRLL
jgi:hypothetical protein